MLYKGETENFQITPSGKSSKSRGVQLSKTHRVQLSTFLLVNLQCHSCRVKLSICNGFFGFGLKNFEKAG